MPESNEIRPPSKDFKGDFDDTNSSIKNLLLPEEITSLLENPRISESDKYWIQVSNKPYNGILEIYSKRDLLSLTNAYFHVYSNCFVFYFTYRSLTYTISNKTPFDYAEYSINYSSKVASTLTSCCTFNKFLLSNRKCIALTSDLYDSLPEILLYDLESLTLTKDISFIAAYQKMMIFYGNQKMARVVPIKELYSTSGNYKLASQLKVRPNAFAQILEADLIEYEIIGAQVKVRCIFSQNIIHNMYDFHYSCRLQLSFLETGEKFIEVIDGNTTIAIITDTPNKNIKKCRKAIARFYMGFFSVLPDRSSIVKTYDITDLF